MSVASPRSIAETLLAELTEAVGPENVLARRDELVVYECDGYVIEKNVARRRRLPDRSRRP